MANNLYFILRDAKAKKETPIHLIFTYEGNRFKYSTGQKITPKYWKTGKNRAKVVSNSLEALNNLLDFLEENLRTFYREQIGLGKTPTNEMLRTYLDDLLSRERKKTKININDPKRIPGTFWAFTDWFLERAKKRINQTTGQTISELQIRKYETALNFLAGYQKERMVKIEFESFNLDFLLDFREYFFSLKQPKTGKNYSQNYFSKIVVLLKIILNDATQRGINRNLSFKSVNFSVKKEETTAIYLNENELDLLFELDLSQNKRLEKVRDLFLIGAYTGLRFSDFSSLNIQHFRGEFLKVNTKKTGEQVSVPIHHRVKAIMKRYEGETGNSLPRPLSNQRMNLYLKEIGKIINPKTERPILGEPIEVTENRGGIRISKTVEKWELLTTHTARRTFCSLNYLAGFPVTSLMKISGHKTESSFMKYIRLSGEEHAQLLKEHWEETSRKNMRAV